MNRREFLLQSALWTTVASASWLGYRYLNRLPTVSLDKVGLPLAHALRDAQLPLAPAHEHDCDVLILGSGAAALSAAWYLAKNNQPNFLIAEGFDRNGNNAAYAFSSSLHAPTGAHYLPQPSAESSFVREMLADLAMIQGYNAAGNPVYHETDLVHAPDERVWVNGTWQDGLLPQRDADSVRFFQFIQQISHAVGTDGRKAFAMPVALSSQDEQWRKLDTLTFADWLKQQAYQSPNLLWYLDYCCRDDYGQGIAQVSAFAGLHYFAARGNENAAVLTWASGLNHLSEKIRQFIGLQELPQFPNTQQWAFKQPASVPAVALRIQERDDVVEVTLRHTQSGDTRLVRAKKVICAMPLMVAKRVVQDAEQYGFSAHNPLPESAPWLVSQFVLHQFPNEPAKTELAWDNVVQHSRGLGYVVATHQAIRVAKPTQTIFTAYAALNHDTPANVRRALLAAEPRDLLDIAAQDLLTVYGGKRFWQHVSHVHITARAHAMAVPQVGYLSQPLYHALRQHRSRLLFAHSDMSGYSVFEEAAYWGVQAALAVLDK